MAQITINVADNKVTEIEDAFVASYANPDNLTPSQLVKRHVKNYVRGVLAQHKRKLAQAEMEASLDTGADI